ncbi:MAG TPA: DUF3224 domain-containing protein [Pseudonocardiaceae bacterium]
MTNGKAEFRIASWDENAYAEFADARKLTRANITQTYTGDLVGEGTATLLMSYGAADAPVYYTGLEHFSGTLDGKSGTFVAQQKGAYAAGVANTTWFVVPGSGTGELAGLRGEGRTEAVGGEESVPVTFEYHVEA